jgi:hypothetical protein
MEAVDTTGRMVMQMLGGFAEFELRAIDGSANGLEWGWQPQGTAVRGREGRLAKLSPDQQQEVIRAVREGSKTAADAVWPFGLH